jgi:hypothetical protein
MKSFVRNIQYIILLGLFGFAAITPVYAAPGQGGFFKNTFNRFFQNNQHQEDSEASSSPKPTFPPKNEFREEVRENIGTRPGFIKPKILTRAAIGIGSVTAINGTTLTVLGKDGKTYTVQTDDKTQFRRHYWGKGSLTEIQIGDSVSVMGKWTDDAHTIIQASFVRDVSIQKFLGVFFGTVQSLTGSGWVMTTIGRGNQTVTVSSSTKFINRKGQIIAQSDIAVGHRIRIRGLWDRTANTITEVKEVKDFNLPVIAVPTTTAGVTPTVTLTPTMSPTPTITPTVTPTATPTP